MTDHGPTKASLIQRRHMMIAGAALIAILVPIRMSSTPLPPGTGAPPPERAVPRLSLPPRPVAALEGRLFFAAPPATGQTVPEQTAEAANAPPASPAPTLLGTAINRTGKAVAVLRGASGAQMLNRGESIDGWRITAIADGTVTVRSASDTQILTLRPPEASAPSGERP